VKYAVAPLALLLGLGLAACGSDDTSEASDTSGSAGAASSSGATDTTGASSEFCEALLSTAQLETGADVAELHDTLEATGLPDDAGEDAQAGFELYLGILDDVDEDATAEDLAQMQDPGLSKAEQGQVDAMVQYATTSCTAGMGHNSESPEAPESESPSAE
jgi:hypothetical protein